jgi:hypothetical protein
MDILSLVKLWVWLTSENKVMQATDDAYLVDGRWVLCVGLEVVKMSRSSSTATATAATTSARRARVVPSLPTAREFTIAENQSELMTAGTNLLTGWSIIFIWCYKRKGNC